MYPILFKYGVFTVHTYGVFIALGFLAAVILASVKAMDFRLQRDFVLDLGFWVIITGILGARVLDVVTNLGYYTLNPISMIKIWEGGLSFFGGLAGGLLGGIAFCRLKKVPVFLAGDLVAPYLALGQSIGRIGCFFAGCCYGKPCQLFSVVFNHPQSLAPRGIGLYPIQIMESIADFIIFLVLFNVAKKRSFQGQVFSLYLILYPAIRFVAEFYRGDNPVISGNLTFYQYISIGVLLIGIVLYVYNGKFKRI